MDEGACQQIQSQYSFGDTKHKQDDVRTKQRVGGLLGLMAGHFPQWCSVVDSCGYIVGLIQQQACYRWLETQLGAKQSKIIRVHVTMLDSHKQHVWRRGVFFMLQLCQGLNKDSLSRVAILVSAMFPLVWCDSDLLSSGQHYILSLPACQ